MIEYKMCANEEMAIDILEFIKRNYEKHSDQAGVKKYLEALQMGIDALTTVNNLRTENKRLEDALDIVKQEYDVMFTANRNLMAEIERLQKAIKVQDIMIEQQDYKLKSAKSEAYKEAIEKLKEHLCNYDLPNYHSFRAVDEDTIDEVFKELVGDKNG